MEKSVIFTDDSNIKLPEIYRSKKILGRGTTLQENRKVLVALEEANLPIPKKDVDLESKYRKALYNFTRPARLMFAGSFGEIRNFRDTVGTILPTNLYILSERYGLLSENDMIIPYDTTVETTVKRI